MNEISARERYAIASAVGVHEQYLYQCFTRRRVCAPELCVSIELATQGAVRRWDLRPTDWHRIWPELVGVDGAPVIGDFSPADAGASADCLTSATGVR